MLGDRRYRIATDSAPTSKSAISSLHYSRPLTTNSSKPPAVPHTPPKSNSSSSKRHNPTYGAQRYKISPFSQPTLPWLCIIRIHDARPRIYPVIKQDFKKNHETYEMKGSAGIPPPNVSLYLTSICPKSVLNSISVASPHGTVVFFPPVIPVNCGLDSAPA